MLVRAQIHIANAFPIPHLIRSYIYLVPILNVAFTLNLIKSHHTTCSLYLSRFLERSLAIPLPSSCHNTQGFAPGSRAQLKGALNNCAKELTKCDCSISQWDVSKVRDMSGMFRGATSFNGDISKWDVSGVGNMKDMFRDAQAFKQNLCGAGWVHSSAIKAGMFIGSSGSISRQVCASNRPSHREVCATTRRKLVESASGFKISSNDHLKSEVAKYLDRSPTGNCSDCPQGAIGEWDVSRVTDMSDVFSGANMFNGDISKWDVSHVTDMNAMFMDASSFNGDLSKWDVSRVEDMSNMFDGAKAFKGDISKWDVSNVKHMTDMFSGAQGFDTFDCLTPEKASR